MTSLFAIVDGKLKAANPASLAKESLVQDWVEADPGLLGLDALIIGKQVRTAYGKYIDLLAMDTAGGLIIIELKKDRTPREVVAQILDYASWVRTLSTRDVYNLAATYLKTRLDIVFRERFGGPIPEQLNASHSMLIVASEMDPTSQRIMEYLSETWAVAINTAFFNVFQSDSQQWLTTNFLLDQEEVEQRSGNKVQSPWSGFYFVNAGLSDHRSWQDMKRYGFVAAGGGNFFSGRLYQLSPGDKIFVYDKGKGYIGYGIVTREAQPASEFVTPDGPLFDQPLDAPGMKRDGEPLEMAEHVVGVRWEKTFEPIHAKRFKGAFANQNVVCKLRDAATVDFLIEQFGVTQSS